MTTKAQNGFAEIKALTPANQLRLAAELIEAGQNLDVVHAIVDRISTELGAVAALRMVRK